VTFEESARAHFSSDLLETAWSCTPGTQLHAPPMLVWRRYILTTWAEFEFSSWGASSGAHGERV